MWTLCSFLSDLLDSILLSLGRAKFFSVIRLVHRYLIQMRLFTRTDLRGVTNQRDVDV